VSASTLLRTALQALSGMILQPQLAFEINYCHYFIHIALLSHEQLSTVDA
jgi:hypothetical protein